MSRVCGALEKAAMPGGARAILIVERDQPTAELYQRALSREYQVFTCTDERAAIEVLDTRTISAVVLEPALDSGQGWHLLATIQEACRRRTIPIIVCSTLDERRRALELGVAAYLTKPVLPVTLQDTLRQVIRSD
jgi:DNA-binding response OmpR family regulator